MKEYEVEPTGNAFVFEYGGTYRAFPKFEVVFTMMKVAKRTTMEDAVM